MGSKASRSKISSGSSGSSSSGGSGRPRVSGARLDFRGVNRVLLELFARPMGELEEEPNECGVSRVSREGAKLDPRGP